MTGEELAVLIQKGGHDDMIPVLWDRVSKLLELKAVKYFDILEERFTDKGYTLEDVKQEMYFAFLTALRYFDPNSGFRFVTYLEAPVRSLMVRLTEKSTPNSRISLDAPAVKGDDALLSDITADEMSDVEAEVMRAVTKEILDEEIKKLSPQRRKVIRLYYYNWRTDTDIAESLKTSPSNIYRIRHMALAELKKSRNVQSVYYSVKR